MNRHPPLFSGLVFVHGLLPVLQFVLLLLGSPPPLHSLELKLTGLSGKINLMNPFPTFLNPIARKMDIPLATIGFQNQSLDPLALKGGIFIEEFTPVEKIALELGPGELKGWSYFPKFFDLVRFRTPQEVRLTIEISNQKGEIFSQNFNLLLLDERFFVPFLTGLRGGGEQDFPESLALFLKEGDPFVKSLPREKWLDKLPPQSYTKIPKLNRNLINPDWPLLEKFYQKVRKEFSFATRSRNLPPFGSDGFSIPEFKKLDRRDPLPLLSRAALFSSLFRSEKIPFQLEIYPEKIYLKWQQGSPQKSFVLDLSQWGNWDFMKNLKKSEKEQNHPRQPPLFVFYSEVASQLGLFENF